MTRPADPDTAPFPYASALYGAREDLLDRTRPTAGKTVAAGGRERAESLRCIESRIAELEAEAGEGYAWTPLDRLRWRRGSRPGRHTVSVPASDYDWVALAADLAGAQLPRSWRST